MTFRLQARNLLLTYPNCDADPQQLLDFVRGILSVKHYSIGRERHESGEPHLHGFFQLERKCDLRGADCLDFLGFHGDYKAARKPDEAVKYTQKDGDFITDYVEFRERIRSCKTRKEFMDTIIEEGRIHQYRFWSDYRETEEADPPFPDFPDRGWFQLADRFDYHPAGKRPVALYLFGPPQTGKTTYISKRFPENFVVSGPKDFSRWFNESIFFFDDFDYEKWKYEVSFLNSLITFPRSVLTPAYYGIKKIPWPRKVIFASNDDVSMYWQSGFIDRLEVIKTY